MQIYKDKYLIEKDERGYSILKPKDKKPDDGYKVRNNNDLLVNENIARNRKFKRTIFNLRKKPIPYDVVPSPSHDDISDVSPNSDRGIQSEDDLEKFRRLFVRKPDSDGSVNEILPNSEIGSETEDTYSYEYDDDDYDNYDDYSNDIDEDDIDKDENLITYGKVVSKNKY